MEWYRSKRFWVVAVIIAVVIMFFLSGRYVMECFRLRRDIAALTKEAERRSTALFSIRVRMSRVQGAGCRVQGAGCRVWGVG